MNRGEKDHHLSRWWLAAAMCFGAAILLVNLGSDGIYAAQEGRSAIIARNMVRSGDWLSMEFPGAIPHEKPILHAWMCAVSGLVFGIDRPPEEVLSELAVRLPSALAALAALAAAGLLAARIYSRRTAAVAIVALASMATFANLGRLAHIDMPLTASYAWAMVFLYVGYWEKRRSNCWIYGFYAMLGVGMMLKGPVTLLLAGFAGLALMLIYRDWTLPFKLKPLLGIPLFLAVWVPWYAIEIVRTDGAFFDEFIVNQNFRRFTGVESTYRDGEFMALWYYFPKFLAGALPWSIAGLLALWPFRKSIVRFRPKFEFRLFKSFRPATIFLLTWVATGFIFFSLSYLKRGDYILPLYPAAAILIARAVELCLDRCPALSRKWLWGFGIIAGLAVAAMLLNSAGFFVEFGEKVARREIKWVSRRDGMNMAMIGGFIQTYAVWFWGLLAVILAGLFSLGRLLEKRRIWAAFAGALLALLAGFTAYHAVLQPGTDQYKTVKGFAFEVREMTPPDAEFCSYADFNTELLYFLDRPYCYVPEAGVIPASVRYVIAGNDADADLLAAEPATWRRLSSTVERHQYPQVLLERIPAHE